MKRIFDGHRTALRILMCLLSFASGCGSDSKTPESMPAIYGGQRATPSQLDFLGVMRIDRAACTGVAITASHVLTAAHCLTGHDFVVAAGDDLASKRLYDGTGRSFGIADYRMPEQITLEGNLTVKGFDLAVVKLDRQLNHPPLAFMAPNEARHVLAANKHRQRSPQSGALMVGYGLINDSPFGHQRGLHQALVPFRGYYGLDDNDELLVGSGEQHACAGDSGSPLLLKDSQGSWRLAGIASRSLFKDNATSCDYTVATIYTFVSHEHIANWIMAQIADLGEAPL